MMPPAAPPGPEPDVPDRVRAALAGAVRPVCAYVYDTAVLRARAAAVRAALPPGAGLLYAVKANGHPEVVSTLAACCDGLEVASGGELELARTAGAGVIAISGPGKTDAELAAAVAAGAVVHVESDHELRRLDLAARAAGAVATAAIRVNRSHPALPGSHRMTGTPSQFGVPEAGLGAVCALAGTLGAVRVIGFHLHAVSNNLDAAAHGTFTADALTWAAAAAARHGVDLSYVNVGGGLGIDYTGCGRFDLAAYAAALAPAARTLPAGARLVLEPGRFLTAPAGWYAAEVLDLKRHGDHHFAVLRGGTHHFRLPAAWGYSHPFAVLPVDRWPYPFPRPQVAGVAVDAVGELCTPRDVLTRGQPVRRLRIGDVLVFDRAGGYGWDISHREFLRHPYPQLLVV
jgi:diaminopimelate decarboxylase